MMHVDINSCVGRCVTTRGKFIRMKERVCVSLEGKEFLILMTSCCCCNNNVFLFGYVMYKIRTMCQV